MANLPRRRAAYTTPASLTHLAVVAAKSVSEPLQLSAPPPPSPPRSVPGAACRSATSPRAPHPDAPLMSRVSARGEGGGSTTGPRAGASCARACAGGRGSGTARAGSRAGSGRRARARACEETRRTGRARARTVVCRDGTCCARGSSPVVPPPRSPSPSAWPRPWFEAISEPPARPPGGQPVRESQALLLLLLRLLAAWLGRAQVWADRPVSGRLGRFGTRGDMNRTEAPPPSQLLARGAGTASPPLCAAVRPHSALKRHHTRPPHRQET
jgi:hypothetical protein